MTEYYVDPTATGDDDGTTKPNAWTTWKRAIDGTDGTQPTAADTVLLRHVNAIDEQPAAQISLNPLPGSSTVGLVQWIGVNSSWVNDGTRYIIDGTSLPATTDMVFSAITTDYNFFSNMMFQNSTGDGFSFGSSSGPLYNAFNNCGFLSNGARGLDAYRNSGGVYFRCLFKDNGDDGINPSTNARLLFCRMEGNTSYGSDGVFGNKSVYLACIFNDNTFSDLSEDVEAVIINCVINGKATTNEGINVNDDRIILIGNRITNHVESGASGIEGNNNIFYSAFNYLENNDTNITEDTLHYPLLVDGADTNQEDTPDTNQGYVSLTGGSEDFNLRSDATLRRTAIQIPES